MSYSGLSQHIDMKARRRNKRRRVLAVVCNVLGIAILLGVIVLLLPLVLPRATGIQVYNVETGSMEPEIPVGSAVFVQPTDPAEVAENEVIAFAREDAVVVHRVVANNVVEGALVTKGDANAEADLESVPYANFQGTVALSLPALGDFAVILTTPAGKIYLLALALCGVLFNILASRLRTKSHQEITP